MSEPHKDYEGAKLGMWLFLFTEILLFGGLFVLFAVYMARHHDAFHVASGNLDVRMGTANTVVLITSSWLVAMAVAALKRGQVAPARRLTLGTIALAGVFLVIKYFEWSAKFHHGLYPGSEHLAAQPPGEAVYFAMYYAMTGLHGIHVTVGMAVLGFAWWFMRTGRCTPEHFVFLENGALYWHLVDLIWIYLFPLFYLVG
jgi:cytochrome c oxidase subunit 3